MKEQHRLAAIMFTDITDYSAMMSKDEHMAMQVLKKNRSIHKSAISRFNGEYIKEVGDGTLAIFQSSIDAVNCALVIRKASFKEKSYKVRIGIHTGEIVLKDGDVFGDGVNIGSRIEAVGDPGGIYISEKVYDDIKNKLGITTEFFGEKQLKNIDHPIKIYSIGISASTKLIRSPSRLSKSTPVATWISPPKKAIIPWSLILIGIGASLVIIVAFLLFYLPGKKTGIENERIAVAIFENRTGDASLDILGIMTADRITQGLSRTIETDVVPTTTVLELNRAIFAVPGEKQRSDYLQKLARMTKAGVIVSGSYYLLQGELQFQAEAKDTRDGKFIFAFPAVSGSEAESADLIEKLSKEIIGGLTMHFKVQDLRYVTKPPSIDAYKEYITGMELYSRGDEETAQHLIRSARLDSLFFPPQFELAWWYQNRGEYKRSDSVLQTINNIKGQLTPFERHYLDAMLSYLDGNLDEALHHFQLAAKISPGDWTVNYVLGATAVFVNRPGITVETLEKLELPDSYKPIGDFGAWQFEYLADAHHLLGNYHQEVIEARKGQLYYPAKLLFYMIEARALAALGQFDELQKTIDRCQSISAGPGINAGYVIYRAARELRVCGYDRESQDYALQAIEWYRNRPPDMDIRIELLGALYLAKMWNEAQALCEQLLTEFPDNIDYLGFQGLIAAGKGDRKIAMVIIEKLRQTNNQFLYGSHFYHMAEIAAQLGERGQAVELLKESFAQGQIFIPLVKSNPAWEPIKDYPPFQDLMKPRD